MELYSDGISYVELLDFSRANVSEESRIEYIQQVASICYQSKPDGRKLYDKLYAESLGLPSSSFEFVPVLLTEENIDFIIWNHYGVYNYETIQVLKYGEWVDDYLLTNLRALIADVGKDINKFFNTSEEEISIIKKHFKVFKYKIPLFVARQINRHRSTVQEMSRRFVSHKKYPIEFYISDELLSVEEVYKDYLELYNQYIELGVKPQDARQVLPTAMYTEIYSAWYPSQLKNMLELRTKVSTQKEFRLLALAIKELLDA